MTIKPCPYPHCVGPDGNAVLTAEGICASCRVKVERDLIGLAETYTRLHLALVPGRTSVDDKVSGTKSPAPPLRLSMLVHSTMLVEILTTWETELRQHLALSLPERATRDGWRIQHAARFLTRRLDMACAVAPASAVDLCHGIAGARRLLGLTRLLHRLSAPCPDCDLLALVREDGAAYVRCRACGATWSEDLYHSLARAAAAEYDM